MTEASIDKPVLTNTARSALRSLRADAVTVRTESLLQINQADAGVLEKLSMTISTWNNWLDAQNSALKSAAEIDREERRLMGVLALTAKDMENNK